MRKFIFVLIYFSFMMNCFASNFVGGDVIDGVFIKKINGDIVEPKRGQFIIDSDTNEYVYCLEPFVKVKRVKFIMYMSLII